MLLKMIYPLKKGFKPILPFHQLHSTANMVAQKRLNDFYNITQLVAKEPRTLDYLSNSPFKQCTTSN